MASFEGQNLQSDKRKKKNKVKGNIIHILACYIYILCYFAQGILQRNRICYACRVKWDKQKPSKIPWCCIAQTALCFKRNHEGMMALQSFSWTFLLFAPLVSCLLPLSSLFLFSYCLLLVSYHEDIHITFWRFWRIFWLIWKKKMNEKVLRITGLGWTKFRNKKD